MHLSFLSVFVFHGVIDYFFSRLNILLCGCTIVYYAPTEGYLGVLQHFGNYEYYSYKYPCASLCRH